MNTPRRAETRPTTRDAAVNLPRGWTEHSHDGLRPPLLTGTMLDDRFELLGRLGEGGMADLYFGDDRVLRCKVAIKILRDDSADSRQRFLREAEVLSNVHHENLVDVLHRGIVQANGRPYTVLRLLPGEDLKTRLLEGGPLPWATVVEIGLQITDVLRCLHDAGALHRDVKPENVLWTHHTSRRVFVKLIDLGAAKTSVRFQSRQDRSYTPVCGRRETAIGAVVGTPAYMPPEAGRTIPDVRTDIYALGVTLYELCTGKLPDDPIAPTPARAANPKAKIPEDLERVIMAALHWNLDDRTPSAARLFAELSALRAVHGMEPDEGGLFAGRVELREHLATGAEAEVFRGFHRKLRRPVALKRQLEGAQSSPDDRARFEREAWVLASVKHPGLPEVYDSGVADGRAYTIMELCPGRPAQRFCADGARLRVAEVLAVGIQVAEAMQAIHAIGVIHRDLSAQNVLIDAGREPRVKVIDFTGCLLTDRFFNLRDEPRSTEDLEVTRDRALHMLPFAAPEVRADRKWSERSDVFALGMLLYRLLSGKIPYTTQARDTYIRLPRGHLHDAADPVLAAMLHPDPEQRLADMESVAERLRDALEEVNCEDEAPPRPALTLVAAPEQAAAPAVSSVGETATMGPMNATAEAMDTPVDIPIVGAASGEQARRVSTRWGLALVVLSGGLLAWHRTPEVTTPPGPGDIEHPQPVATSTVLDGSSASRAQEASEPPAPLRSPGAPESGTDAVSAPPQPAAILAEEGADPELARLGPSEAKRMLHALVKKCTRDWLALKLRVTDGIGRVEKINGFKPTAPTGVERCIVDAVAATRFPSTEPMSLTLSFEP